MDPVHTSWPGVPCHVPRVKDFKCCRAHSNSFNPYWLVCPWRLVGGLCLRLFCRGSGSSCWGILWGCSGRAEGTDAPPWPPELLAPPWPPNSYGLQSSQLCLGAPKCLFRLLQSTHPPSPVVLLQCGLRLPGGGVMSVVCGVQCWEGYFGNVIGCRLSKKKITIRYFPKERSLSRACTLVSSWVQERSVEGFPCRQRREPPDPQSKRNRTHDTVVGQGCRGDQSRRAPWVQEVDEAAGEATAIRWSRVV